MSNCFIGEQGSLKRIAKKSFFANLRGSQRPSYPISQIDQTAILVIPSVVEESLTISVARDYNFWVYIMTNEHDSVLYVGMTNDLAKRVSEHRVGEIPGFTANYAETGQLRTLHKRAGYHHS